MKTERLIEALEADYLSSTNLEALIHLDREVVHCTLPMEKWISDYYGKENGENIVKAITNMNKKIGDVLTPEQLHVLLTNDLTSDNIGGWNGRKVQYKNYIVEAWDIQEETQVSSIKFRIIEVWETVEEREDHRREAERIYNKMEKNGESLVYIADPFSEEYILTGNNSISTAKHFSDIQIKKDHFTIMGWLHKDKFEVVNVDDYSFIYSNADRVYSMRTEYIKSLYRRDSFLDSIIFMDEPNVGNEDFLEWYDDVYGDSLFANEEKMEKAYKEYTNI